MRRQNNISISVKIVEDIMKKPTRIGSWDSSKARKPQAQLGYIWSVMQPQRFQQGSFAHVVFAGDKIDTGQRFDEKTVEQAKVINTE